MATWRVRLRQSCTRERAIDDGQAVAVALPTKVHELERKFRGSKAYAVVATVVTVLKDVPPERWNAFCVFCLYCVLQLDRVESIGVASYYWKDLSSGEVEARVRQLVEKVGPETAVAAVKAVHSPKLHWVESDLLGFLLRDSTFSRFVLPIIVARKTRRHGEQSEWSQDRGESGCEEIQI